MFVVPQVDGEGYVLPGIFVDVVINSYTEDSLKTLAKELVPNCVTEGNTVAKSKCKTQKILL